MLILSESFVKIMSSIFRELRDDLESALYNSSEKSVTVLRVFRPLNNLAGIAAGAQSGPGPLL